MLVAAFFIVALSCSIVIFISDRNAAPYEATRAISTLPANYSTAENIAVSVAQAWDPGSRLVRAGGSVPCDAENQFAKEIVFEFGASKSFIGFSLYDYIWRLRYAADHKDYQTKNLRFEIDSRTGELLHTSQN